jgi:hypothetical protein
MAREFCIACSDCKVFIWLHKWPVVEDVRDRCEHGRYDHSLFPDHPSYEVVAVTAAELARCIRQAASDPECQFEYIQALVPRLKPFVQDHVNHQLFLSGDCGDEPWSLGDHGWWEWKELPGYFGIGHDYLPHNLIEDAGIRDYLSAVRHLARDRPLWRVADEPVSDEEREYKAAFEKALRQYGN